MEHQDFNPKLRKFGLTVGVGFAAIALISFYRGHVNTPKLFWVLAGALCLLGLVRPRLLLPVQRAWMILATILAWLNTRIILTTLFYAVFTPIGIAMRLFRDPLHRQPDGATTYWVPRKPSIFDPKDYENQF